MEGRGRVVADRGDRGRGGLAQLAVFAKGGRGPEDTFSIFGTNVSALARQHVRYGRRRARRTRPTKACSPRRHSRRVGGTQR